MAANGAGRVERNRRGIKERIFDGEHLTLEELRARLQHLHHGYLYNHIPSYPRLELHVTHLSHSTDLSGLHSIKQDGGFRDPYERELVWFSLTVTPEDLGEAEDRDMKIVRPSFREELFRPQQLQRGFLQSFATSPAFRSSSRYGSYRFTFSLRDVLDKYSRQFCFGKRPMMRKWKTVLYKQEVMYVVLVHSPTNWRRFSHLPLLSTNQEADPICEFREYPEPHFVWRPQAMSNVHRYQLSSTGLWDVQWRYFVWDHVAIALDVGDEVFRFGDEELRDNLRYCQKEKPSNETFEYFYVAQDEVYELWPWDGYEELESFHNCMFTVN